MYKTQISVWHPMESDFRMPRIDCSLSYTVHIGHTTIFLDIPEQNKTVSYSRRSERYPQQSVSNRGYCDLDNNFMKLSR